MKRFESALPNPGANELDLANRGVKERKGLGDNSSNLMSRTWELLIEQGKVTNKSWFKQRKRISTYLLNTFSFFRCQKNIPKFYPPPENSAHISSPTGQRKYSIYLIQVKDIHSTEINEIPVPEHKHNQN